MPFDGVESPLGPLARFDQVIELIDAPGKWVKHAYRTPAGRYCLKEALTVAGVADVFEPAILKAAEAVMEREFCCVESFNDFPLTTHGDVVAVLRRTRDDLVAGKAALPAAGQAAPAMRWNEYRAPAAKGWAASLWHKVFC